MHAAALGVELASVPAVVWLTAGLICLMVLDLLSGWLAAVVTGTVSSRVSWVGVTRKGLTLCVILAVAVVNVLAPAPLNQFPLLLPVLLGYVVTETWSILENADRAGALPASVARLFRRAANESGTDAGSRAGADLAGRDRPGYSDRSGDPR